VELILENNPDLVIPQDLALKLTQRAQSFRDPFFTEEIRKLLEVLIWFDKKLKFTPEIHRAINERFQHPEEKEVKRLFLSLEKTD
jgi:hypothetical protein